MSINDIYKTPIEGLYRLAGFFLSLFANLVFRDTLFFSERYLVVGMSIYIILMFIIPVILGYKNNDEHKTKAIIQYWIFVVIGFIFLLPVWIWFFIDF